jgi:large subunit ribosomal protein L4
MNVKVYSKEGKELRDIELSDKVFGLPINDDVIWSAINNELANKRQGNASTKDRGEVHGSNTKPFKQKGTGRARQGDKKSPVTVGGGVVFGPKPRDFSYSIPRKAKRLAIKSVLSLKAQNQNFKVVEDFSVESGKTKDILAVLKNFEPGQRTVLIMKDDDPLIKRAAGNIPWLSYISYKRLQAHTLFYARNVIALETAVKGINDMYGVEKQAKEEAAA